MRKFHTIVAVVLSCAGLWNPASAEPAILDRLAAEAPVIVAHRSADIAGTPENSLAWITAAAEAGIDMVHINPQMTADGQYVLMHDPTLNRMTNVETVFPDGAPGGPTRAERSGLDYVRDYTLEEVRLLRLNGTDQPPTELGEALDAGADQLLLLGLKNYEVESLATALAGRPTGNLMFFELYVSGTDQSKLRALGEKTGIAVSVTLYNTRDAEKDLARVSAQLPDILHMVVVPSARATPEFQRLRKEMGLYLAVSGTGRSEDSKLTSQGDVSAWRTAIQDADAAMTDLPVQLVEALR